MTTKAQTSFSKSRALAIGLLVLLLAAVLGVFLSPLAWLYNRYDKILVQSADQMVRYQRVAATKPQVEARLAAVKAKDVRSGFLKNTAPALAASEVQDRAKTLIESNGGRLNAIQILPHKDEARYRQVGVNIQLSANMPALRRILHALEGERPYLLVDNMTIRSFQNINYKPSPGLEPEMFIQFDVVGLTLSGGK
jgi:general secretion pathway protein M